MIGLEVKRDARTGERLITEPTSGGPGLSSTLAEAAGVELHEDPWEMNVGSGYRGP